MNKLQFIMVACPQRQKFVDEVKALIPNLRISMDDFPEGACKYPTNAFLNFQRAWSWAGDSPSVMLEDDIILCDDFMEKILYQIAQRPNEVIQFFSMRKDDLSIGSRYDTGSKFMMCQCYYLPSGLGAELHEYSKGYYEQMEDGVIPSDSCIASFLKHRKMKYWISVPSLVEHRIAPSIAGPGRSKYRQSKTFNNKHLK